MFTCRIHTYTFSLTVLPVLDRVDSLTMLKYWSDLHWSTTRIVSRINSLFKFRLFVFFLCGLMHLMFTPYLLSLTILNVDIDILPHIIQRALWFVVHIFRVVLVIYPCALLGEEVMIQKYVIVIVFFMKIRYCIKFKNL